MVKLIKTRDFGELEVDESAFISFPIGLYGFENCHNFALIAPNGENVFPMWLQSIDATEPCFIVFDPFAVSDKYTIDISSEDMALLQLEDKSDVRALSLAVIPEDYTKTTINLRCPILINIKKNIAIQTILDTDYQIRFPIFSQKEV